MEKNIWEINSLSADLENPSSPPWNRRFIAVFKIPPLVPTFSQLNPAHVLKSHSLRAEPQLRRLSAGGYCGNKFHYKLSYFSLPIIIPLHSSSINGWYKRPIWSHSTKILDSISPYLYYCLNIYFNIILISTPTSFTLTPSIWLSDQHFVCISPCSHAFYVPPLKSYSAGYISVR